MKSVWELTSENLTNLGGAMGTAEYTYPNWNRLFDSFESAKAFAENDFLENGKNSIYAGRKIIWTNEDDEWHSQDLAYVMYHIRQKPIEGN